jgi:hypothetical protein
MRRNFERYFSLAILSAIFACIVFVYYPASMDRNYQGEDYLLISQVLKVGPAKALLLSWKDHFIPLYRITMGGLHILFGNAIPIRVLILAFHLANTALVFYIVRRGARSTILAAVGAATFGLSRQASIEILHPINGTWVMSLFFVLLMSIFLDKFVASRSRGLDGPSGAAASQDDASSEIGDNSAKQALNEDEDEDGKIPASPSTRFLTDITLQPSTWNMKYYYAALAAFVAGLGMFTIALVGGTLIWAFMYARMMRVGEFRRSMKLQAKVVLPFVFVIAAYLLMRSHFIEASRPFTDSMTLQVLNRPSVSLEQIMSAIGNLPMEFYATAAGRAMPYFQEHGFVALVILGLLLIKEFVYRKREAGIASMWLIFSFVTFAVPVFARMFFVLRAGGDIQNVLFPWYFYLPMTGIAIALGLLLKPPPVIEDALSKRPVPAFAILLATAITVLTLLNIENAKEVRALTPGLVEENRRFNELLLQYRGSMESFLGGPGYTPEREYFFKDTVSAGMGEFPLSWFVMHHDVFYLYFSDTKNIRFINGWKYYGDLHFWHPEGTVKRRWHGGMGL